MHEPIISVSGIRGIFGKSLTPLNITKYVSGFAEYLKSINKSKNKNIKVLIGRDGRLGGDIIENLVQNTLLFCGCSVINIGIAPTPTIALAVKTLKASGGISITASHNPQQWNGLKFLNSRGIFLDKTENNSLSNFFNNENFSYVSENQIKPVEYYYEFANYHIAKVLSIKYLNISKIKKRRFKIVVDCVNASGSAIIPKLLEKLGCKVIKLDCSLNGVFNRPPEPLPENIKKTCKAVLLNKADLGLVIDPDADRLVIITEKGEPFGEENTVTAAIKFILSNIPKSKRIAVVNLSTTRTVDDIVNSLNGKIYKSPVGEINVIKKMKEVNAVIGGEGSGGVILPEVHYCRDSLTAAALILNEFADSQMKVSEYKNTLPQYFIRKSKIDLAGINVNKIFDYLKSHYRNYPMNFDDGLRIDFPNSWVNFRMSNTEPIVRIITEAKTQKEAEKMHNKFRSEIKELCKINHPIVSPLIKGDEDF
jgi:phosphomannomutase